MSNIISSSEWLNFMTTLHNKVRNGKGSKLTGMGALNEINNFLLLFFIERSFDKYKLDDTCRFSYLYETYCSKKVINDEKNVKRSKPDSNPLYKQLHHFYCDTNNPNCLLRKLLANKIIKSYLKNATITICAYTEKVETGKTIQDIIQYMFEHFEKIAKSINKNINDLTLDDFGFDAFGDAYEKFKQQSCQDSGKTTGQHFTPVIAKDYIINELKPKEDEIFYEPACGTGGFIHRTMKYLKDNNKDYLKFIDNVQANECNAEIYKPLSINMLIHGVPIENIKNQDSLDLGYCKDIKGTIDVIATNPPFGPGDKLDYDEYWGPLITGKNIIKESCMAQFIMHIYHTLKPDGRCGTLSDRGIISNGTDKKNSWLTKLRKFMLENMNVYKIVLLPNNTFDYTTFATCILFMKKGSKTTNIEYRELKIKEVNMDGQKQKIIEEDNLLGNVLIENIIKNNYSLKPDDYFKIVEELGEDEKNNMEWIKLGDVCEIIKGKSLTIANMIKGDNKVIGGGYIPMKETHNEYNTNLNEILISNDGAYAGYLNRFNENMFITSHCNKIIPKDINKDFLYYYLKLIQQNIIKECQIGQAQPSLDKNKLKTFLIPNLPLSHQEEIVKFLDEEFEKYDINKLNKNIPLFKLLINKEYEMASELLSLVYRQMASEQECENIKRDIKSIFRLSVYGMKSEMKKLGDICEIVKGNFNSGDMNNNGDIPFYTTSVNSPVGTHDDFTLNKPEYIIFSKDGGNKTNPLSLTSGIAKSYYVQGKSAFASHSIAFIVKNEIKCKYLYYFLTYYRTKLMAKAKYGSGLGSISLTDINNFQIPIPSLELQEEIIKRIEALELETSHYNEYSKMLEKELLNITEIINNMTTSSKMNEEIILNEENNIINEENDEELNDQEDGDEEEEEEYDELEIKGITYILEDENVYVKKDDGQKGQLYGYYKNDKFTRIKKVKSNVV